VGLTEVIEQLNIFKLPYFRQLRQKVMTDYWKAYKEMIEADKLEQTTAETYTVESYNGL